MGRTQITLMSLLSLAFIGETQVKSLQIRPQPCYVSGNIGTCMFVWECIKTEGKHLGTCADGFLFGSCCGHSDTNNDIVPSSDSELVFSKKTLSPVTSISSLETNFHDITTTSMVNISNHSKPSHLKPQLRPPFVKPPHESINHIEKTSSTTLLSEPGEDMMPNPPILFTQLNLNSTTGPSKNDSDDWFYSTSHPFSYTSSSYYPPFSTSQYTVKSSFSYPPSYQTSPTFLVRPNFSTKQSSTLKPSFFTKPWSSQKPQYQENSQTMSPSSSNKPGNTNQKYNFTKPYDSQDVHISHQVTSHSQTTTDKTLTTIGADESLNSSSHSKSTIKPFSHPPQRPTWKPNPPAFSSPIVPSNTFPIITLPHLWNPTTESTTLFIPASIKPDDFSTQSSSSHAPIPFQTSKLPTFATFKPIWEPIIPTYFTLFSPTSTFISTPSRWTDESNIVDSSYITPLSFSSKIPLLKPTRKPYITRKPVIFTKTSSPYTKVKVTSPTSKISPFPVYPCGIPFPQPKMKVVGGTNSAFGSWPWQVSVRRTSFFGFSSTHRCGGALIHQQWVATAGHCVDDLLISQIKIRVGEYDFASSQEPHGYVEKGAKKKVVHPRYNFFTYENDLALVQLEEPINSEKYPHIAPICLPPSEENLVGKNGTVTGWGRLSEGGVLPSVLQEVQVPIISNEKCKNMFLAAGRHEYIPDIFMCAGFEDGGRDSCQGDSGGPLQIQAEEGYWFLAGIISWGIGCAEPNMPGVCTRISKFKDWVIQQIA